MNKKRQTIGRTFSTPVIHEGNYAEAPGQIFTLSSGRKAVFTKVTLPAGEIEKATFVIQETNGRDQAALTPESLKDITRTIGLQQFFPAIGVRRKEGVEILDGSRRRAAALLCKTSLDVLVTDESLTVSEARALAQDIQTAREHNIREVGMRLLALKNSGLSQKEIAEDERMSQAKVTRALQAASVSQDLLSLFPVQAELSYKDYKVLLAAEELLAAKNTSVKELTDNVMPAISLVRENALLAEDEVKNKILAEIRSEAVLIGNTAAADKTTVTPLWQFPDKNRYARKKSRGRMFSYEFNRLSAEIQDDIDKAVQAVLTRHLKD
jgi:ParB family chromosome partitioning protein